MNKYKFMIVFLALIMVFTLSACSDDEVPSETDLEMVTHILDGITISGDLQDISEDLIFTTSGSDDNISITWESSNTDIITNSGEVSASILGDATVIITVTVSLNEESVSKEFTVIVKMREGALCPELGETSIYEITNPGFENGDLCGWTITGDAFKDEYVLDIDTFWTGESYNKDGVYFFTSNDHESDIGFLTSTTFELGGIGVVSFKLGAAKHTDEFYVSFMDSKGTEDLGDDIEISRYGNNAFDDNVYTANMAQFTADLSDYIGSDIYIIVMDNAVSDWSWISMDSFFMYYEFSTDLPSESIVAINLIMEDETAPVISGTSDYNLLTGVSEPNWLDGVTALDETDGVVSVTVDASNVNLSVVGTYEVTYTAIDANSNAGVVVVSVVVTDVDNIDPVIHGTDETVYVINGSTEPDWLTYITATDNVDGNLTSSIVIDKGSFNILVNGVYVFNISVEDANSNEATALFTVEVVTQLPHIINGGFESCDFTGWVATGDAYTELGISSDGGFNSDGTCHFNTWTQESNGGAGEVSTGTLTSSIFELSGSGFITFKIGGAKSESLLYISVYTEAGIEIARYGNPLFNNNGDMNLYKADLSGYIGENLYIKVVDNATSDWAFSMLDSFFTYYVLESDLPSGAVLAANLVVDDVLGPNINGTGDFALGLSLTEPDWLAGITAVDAIDGVLTVSVDTSNVVMGVEGTYTISYLATDLSSNETIVTVTVVISSSDSTSPVISGVIGDMFVVVNSTVPTWLDGVTANDNIDGDISIDIVLDKGSFDIAVKGVYTFTYSVSDASGNETIISVDVEVLDYLPQVTNGGFESCDFTGWTATGDAYTELGISSDGGFNSDGTCHFNTWTQENNGGVGEASTGTLTSSIFSVRGSGYITFKIGGAKDTSLLYISIYNEAGTEIARYGNSLFNSNADMYLYKADLSAFIGQNVYIKVVDNATSDWAFSMLDSFVTYYETIGDIESGSNVATNILP